MLVEFCRHSSRGQKIYLPTFTVFRRQGHSSVTDSQGSSGHIQFAVELTVNQIAQVFESASGSGEVPFALRYPVNYIIFTMMKLLPESLRGSSYSLPHVSLKFDCCMGQPIAASIANRLSRFQA